MRPDAGSEPRRALSDVIDAKSNDPHNRASTHTWFARVRGDANHAPHPSSAGRGTDAATLHSWWLLTDREGVIAGRSTA